MPVSEGKMKTLPPVPPGGGLCRHSNGGSGQEYHREQVQVEIVFPPTRDVPRTEAAGSSSGYQREAVLTVSVRLKSAETWAPAGHEITFEQAVRALCSGNVACSAGGSSRTNTNSIVDQQYY